MPFKSLKEFIKLESSAAVFLFLATLAALIWANLPISKSYFDIIELHVSLYVGDIGLNKPLIFWINEGLMTIFFLLVGLEIKREYLCGDLNSWKKVASPAIAALGGMMVPALIYVAFNHHDATLLRGWATPVATDIAFALGVLMLLGSRVPNSLKIFLTSLAIFDDIGAVIIIAIFYSSKLNFLYLFISAFIILLIYALNRKTRFNFFFYIILGVSIWYSTYLSGVHPSITGVILALLTPYFAQCPRSRRTVSLRRVEKSIHPWVIYGVLPFFAFANAGVSFAEVSSADFSSSLTVGLIVALFFGNQIGVFGLSYLAAKLKITELPTGAKLSEFYGVCILCGVGFTMSFFIGSLSFNHLHESFRLLNQVKLGVMIGSFASGLAGYLLLRWATRKRV